MRRPRQSLRRVFAVPAAVAIFSIVGLVAALTGDGWRDALSWAALAVPPAAIIWAMKARTT
ncbi:MAG: hypothetical protein ABW184_09655 [Sphingobium sp.]